MEIELKLLLDSADVAAFRRHPLLKQLAIAKPRWQRLTTIYFDTTDLHFRRHDAALRVRRADRCWIQTLKAGNQVAAGLHQRHEWESRVAGPQPDLAILREMSGPGAVWESASSDQPLGERLVPAFSTIFRRTIWLLQTAQGGEVELALDQGSVQGVAGGAPISEIELELKSGEPGQLFELAMQFQQFVPLRVCNISKAERGYALFAPQAPAAARATRLKLAGKSTVEQGFQSVIGNCISQIQDNELGVMQGTDPEYVHQMRVGLRRLRTALALFDTVAPCAVETQAEIKWLTSELGAARDWEVFGDSTLAMIAGACPDEPDLSQLQKAALAIARNNRKQAAVAVGSARYSHLLLAVGGAAYGQRWRTLPDRIALEAPLATFAAQTLTACRAKLNKRGKRLKEGAPSTRHRARIAAKEIRYAVEFFESLLPSRRAKSFIAALSTLQDALGWLNDASVAVNLLDRLAQNQPELAQCAAFVRGYLAARTEPELRRLGKLWRSFKPKKVALDARTPSRAPVP
jgi:inorganic triphosphatase YgiF